VIPSPARKCITKCAGTGDRCSSIRGAGQPRTSDARRNENSSADFETRFSLSQVPRKMSSPKDHMAEVDASRRNYLIDKRQLAAASNASAKPNSSSRCTRSNSRKQPRNPKKTNRPMSLYRTPMLALCLVEMGRVDPATTHSLQLIPPATGRGSRYQQGSQRRSTISIGDGLLATTVRLGISRIMRASSPCTSEALNSSEALASADYDSVVN